MLETPTAISTPYSDITYIDPTFTEWKEWFAWRPVKMVHWRLTHGDVPGFRYSKIVWLKKIVRRKVIDWHGGPGRESSEFTKTYYEYTTLMDLLKHGY